MKANRTESELSLSYRKLVLHNLDIGPVILQPFWMNEPNQAHESLSAMPRFCEVRTCDANTWLVQHGVFRPFDTRPRGKRKFLRDRPCIRPGNTLSSMSRSMRGSRTQDPHCCTALLTSHGAVLITASETMLMAPRPSLRRFVSPPRPYLAYLEALAPAEPARDAGLRLSGTTSSIATASPPQCGQAVNDQQNNH